VVGVHLELQADASLSEYSGANLAGVALFVEMPIDQKIDSAGPLPRKLQFVNTGGWRCERDPNARGFCSVTASI
jgi:hypothetical protein